MIRNLHRHRLRLSALIIVLSIIAEFSPGSRACPPEKQGPASSALSHPAAAPEQRSGSSSEVLAAESKTKPRSDLAAFRARVETLLSEAHADKGFWAVLVTDAATGEVLFALNPQRYFTPASTAKLFTTALALTALGPDHRFRTTIETRGAVDRYGRLSGDLMLVGRGDPNLSNRKFPFAEKVERVGPPDKVLAELADAVVARGISQIEGDVVADDSYFDYERFPSGWTIDDMMWGYGAAVSALCVNDNTIFLELRPGDGVGDPAWYNVEPRAEYYAFRNNVRTGPRGSEQKLQVSREPGSRLFVLAGTIPQGAEPHILTLAVEEPAEYAAHLLKRLLEARGVRIYGQPRARHAPASSTSDATVLAEHISIPLAQAVRTINKVSQNLHTELLLRTAAREKAGTTSREAALKFAQDFFKSVGIEDADVVLSDGSGLSRRNLITPRAAVMLLHYAARQPWADVFHSSLPVAGQDGTLAERMKSTPAAGRISAKTGTLEHVNALAGYVTTLHRGQLIFSIFGNNNVVRGQSPDGSTTAPGIIDAICVAMVEELGAPPPEKKK